MVPLIAVTLAAVALAGFGLLWSTSHSDAISIERQVRTTEHAIEVSINELAKEQETVAVWDDPVLELGKSAPNWQWVDDNIAVWLHDLFRHDQVFILDAADRPVYAMVDGARGTPSAYNKLSSDLKTLVDTVRGRLRSGNHKHDRNPDIPVAPGSTLLTTDKAVHDSHLMQVLGRPAAVSLMRIVPLTEKVSLAPGREHLLVSVRFLDGRFLQDLANKNLIASPRFSRSPMLRTGEQALPLKSEHQAFIGYFIWRPELPGTALLQVLAPVTALTVTTMILAMLLLAAWLRRSTGQLQTTLVELRASEAQAQHLAFHDVLTGLPNRALFSDRLDQALARARRGEPVALLALDLDRFKHVNDTLGHHAGDALIREFSSRLAALVRGADTVARLGGDEFAILLSGYEPEQVELLCQRVLNTVRTPFNVLGSNAFVGASIGVVHAPEAGHDRVDLLRKADIALYRAKAEGRDCFRTFTAEMDETVRVRSAIEDDLRVALASGDGLLVHYQPQVNGSGQAIIGLEALVRWQHPTRGLMSPEHFIMVAEETGLICQLGEWVLRKACATSRLHPQLFMAVNLSPVQFRSSGFAERLIAVVREAGADPSRIELEVTEGVLLDDDELVREALKKLRAAGLRIALDDFGTGYSSLSYLRRFEVDKIKIDKSFVQHLGHAVDSAAIITAVVTLGHAMGLTVTAEGVETGDQCRFLTAAGCNQLQGHLFSRAVPEEDLAGILELPDDRVDQAA